MLHRFKALNAAIRRAFTHVVSRIASPRPKKPPAERSELTSNVSKSNWASAAKCGVILGAVVGAGWLIGHPPVQTVAQGDMAIRTNLFTGEVTRWRDGSVLVLPGVHALQAVSLRDQTYRPTQMSRATGSAPVQSVEGLSLGVDLNLRYAIDASKLGTRGLPTNWVLDVIEPAVQAVVYKVMARHTVRDIFSNRRAEIALTIEAELRTRLATEGVLLRSVQIGNVDLPADYRRGLDGLLAEGLATEKMRYTLELKDKRVKETELDAAADKVRREIGAEAAGREQIIAAKAQEEAMKHVLPFKQRQIEQRQLEAEAERVARVKMAEGNAQARRIEAQGEAQAREKLADAEAYRLTKVGKASLDQMAAEGVLITRHPLLIQKAMADKLSDKVQVIIAPPGDGGFIGAALLGARKTTVAAAPEADVNGLGDGQNGQPAQSTKEQ